MNENTLTGRSCETNRRAAKQLDTRRTTKLNVAAVCHTLATRAENIRWRYIKCVGSSS